MISNEQLRARLSGGASNEEVLYDLVQDLIISRRAGKGIVIDIGSGQGKLYGYLAKHIERYIGVDIFRYDNYPTHPKVEFHQVNLQSSRINLSDHLADVVCSLETIEHVENPRALMREMVRLIKPGGIIIVTTPNQLSLASKLCLVLKNEFVHFQERSGLYPAHLSALLEIDLVRLARENALTDMAIAYTGVGRIPLTSCQWPRWLATHSGWRGRAFSDNVILFARKPCLASNLGNSDELLSKT